MTKEESHDEVINKLNGEIIQLKENLKAAQGRYESERRNIQWFVE